MKINEGTFGEIDTLIDEYMDFCKKHGREPSLRRCFMFISDEFCTDENNTELFKYVKQAYEAKEEPEPDLEEAKKVCELFGYRVLKEAEELESRPEEDESEDFDDTDDSVKTMIRELAEETGNEAEDAEVEYNQGPGEYGIMVKWGNEEYLCYESEDDAKAASTEGIKNLFDDIGYEGINFDMLGGIDQFVDRDWFDDAKKEDAEYYVSDIKEYEPERYKEEFGDLDEDEAVKKYLKDGYSDSIEWYIDNFGKKEFNKIVRENNLIDENELAEAITEEDGPANELARYDGKEIELPCGWYCYCSDK